MKNITILFLNLLIFFAGCTNTPVKLTDYVNPLLGTATLWEPEDLGYIRKMKARTWGAEVFPGASLPNAMIQLSPVTQFRSGAGYQYEDTVMYGFTHTNKGHWNLLHIPLLPVAGTIAPNDYQSRFTHSNESARPGYYQVFLERYQINAELTSTLRCAYHKYTYPEETDKKLLADLTRSNAPVRDWNIEKNGANTFSGYQDGEGKMYFYAVANYDIQNIETVKNDDRQVFVVHFSDSRSKKPLELKIGFSFVNIENAKMNLEKEMLSKNFDQVRNEADATWEKLLSKISVKGGTEREKKLFYSCLYRSFLWPALRSDINGDFTDARGETTNENFRYYTIPSFWDDYRNKLILLGMILPDVAADVIRSITDIGEKTGGFMPTFFHGDHASVFVTGSYLRGIRNFDVRRAYRLMLNNATIAEGNTIRPHLAEYMEKGFISEPDIKNVKTETVCNASVTKTAEYSYDDYAVALLAKELGDTQNYELLMKRTGNYKNMFDPETGFMRGRLANGEWIADFDPYYPYYEYMYREANAWQSIFFAPHDTQGLLALFPDYEAVEQKMDSLFSLPWRGYEVDNLTGFIGQYCHGNQPDHGFPYIYTFIGKQEKTQAVLDSIMNHYYDMGTDKLAYAGMDDAGEMSAWYVFNAMGLYTYSPADPEYIVSVPLFDYVDFTLGDGTKFTIAKNGEGQKISNIIYDGEKINGWFISHDKLKEGKKLEITVEK